MNNLEAENVTLDRSHTLNLSVNMSSLGKKSGQSHGTVLPVGLCPVTSSGVSIISSISLVLFFILRLHPVNPNKTMKPKRLMSKCFTKLVKRPGSITIRLVMN